MSVGRRLGAVLRLSSGLLVILALAFIASAVATGPANRHLINARAAHTATAQVDGSLVIAGGTGNRGVLKSLEFFDPVSGKSMPGPRLIEARSGHSAIALADGRVLLTGGRSGDNALLASSEIYDAAGASLNPGASMGHARANHTSTLLADGRVLLAGGNADGMSEIYDPATDRFVDAGRLAVARSGHSAVRLGDGRVLLVGGTDAAGATAEIFDPKTNTSSAVRGGLKTARVQPALKLISDGKVQVYGGDAEITMEVYNPAGYFSSRGHLLRDSSAFRSIMYSPGQAALIAIPSAKSKHYAEDALGPAAGEFERSAHTATEVAARSTMVVVGGYGATGAALDTITELGSCGGTVTTDLTDYSPGQTVVMSGSGWTPGEQITLNLHRDTNDPPDTVLTATADENGDWINAEYLVQEFDLGVTFVLTANGDSGCTAQTTFTDSGQFNYSPDTQALTIAAGSSGSFSQDVTAPKQNGNFTAVVHVVGTGGNPLPASWISTVPGSLSFVTGTSPGGSADTETWLVNVAVPAGTTAGIYTANILATASIGGIGDNKETKLTVAVTGAAATTTTLTSSLNPSTFGDNVTFTATVHAGAPLVTTGSVTFIEGTCASPTATLAGPTALTPSGQAAFSTTTLSVGSHTIVACYGGAAGFSASNGSVVQVVRAVTTTALVSSLNPSTFGDNVTFTATVNAGVPLVTTGSVTFFDGGTCAVPGATLAGPTALNPSGQAAFSTATLTVGSHTIVACYGGATGFAPSSGNVIQVVNAVTTTTLASSLNPSTFGDNVTFTATVHAGVPLVTTGSVTFFDGGTCAVPGATLAGPTALNPSGQAAFSTATLSAATHTIIACYGGAAGFAASSGNVAQVVKKADVTIVVTPYNVTYDTNAHTATGTATGLAGLDLSSGLDLSGTTHTAAGDYPSDAWTFTSPNPNYNDTSGTTHDHIDKANANIVITPYNVVYDTNAHTATGTATGLSSLDLSSGLNLTGTTHTAAGDYPTDAWTFTSPNPNYNDTSGTTHDHIDKANANIVITPYNVVYDTNAHTATGTATGLSSLDLSSGLNLTGTTHTAAGDYPTDAWTFTSPSPNYNDTSGTTHDHIDKANANIVITPYNVVYDTNAHTATGTATGLSSLDLSSGLNLTGTTHTAAGDYPTDAWTFTSPSPNYNDTSGTTHDHIDKANANIVITPYNVVYDTNAHTATGTATGLSSLDLSSGLNLTGTTHTAAGDYPTDAWTFTSPSPNYNDTSGTTHDHIDKANANIVITPYNVVYDTNAHTATGTATGLSSLDLSSGLNLTGTTHTAAGDYPTDAWTFTSPSPNYNDTSGTTHDHIDKANANIVITPYNVVYDTNAHTATGTATGLSSLDLSSGLNLTGTTHTAAGDYPTDAWTFTSPNPNYNDTSGTTHDHIDKANANITVTGYTVTYDGDPHTATGSATGISSLNLSSGLNLTGTTHTNAGDYPTDAWTFTSPNPNYNDASGTVHDHINKATATISVTGYTVTYDGNPHTATGSATGVKGEALVGLNLGGTTHTNAGDYLADPWTFTDATGNYYNASGSVHDHINKATATIVVTGYTVTYDGDPHTASGTATGAKGEALAGLNLTGTTHTNAGDYPADAWAFTDVTGNYYNASGTVHDHINKANATIVVTAYHVTYDTFPHTATGSATGAKSEALAGLNLSGTTHTNSGSYTDSWTFTDVTGNYYNASGQITDVIDPRDALVRYIGQQTFVTSGSSSTTAQVTLSASVQDPTGIALVGAKVDFIDTSTGQVMAGGVPVSPVANSPANTGTANKIVTLSTGQFGAQSYLILVRMTGNYDNSDQVTADKTAGVVVMKPAVTNTTTGGGTYVALGTAAGTYAGGGSGLPTLSVGMSYNKSGTNPKGQIIVTVPQANGVLYIKSNSISSMAISGNNSTIYTKSSVSMLNNGSMVVIDGGVSLRLDTVEGSPGQVGVTVLSSSSVLYYSNNWTFVNNAWRTGTEALSTGSISVE